VEKENVMEQTWNFGRRDWLSARCYLVRTLGGGGQPSKILWGYGRSQKWPKAVFFAAADSLGINTKAEVWCLPANVIPFKYRVAQVAQGNAA
jgi:hypothetical protein